MRPLAFPLAIAALLVCAAADTACSSSVGETVRTTSGLVKGHASPVRPGVLEYLGIPYARPPVGERRFMPPERYESEGEEEDVIDASFWSDECPHTPGKPVDFPHERPTMKEIIANFGGQKGHPQSEDCLKLNVWTKVSEETNKPVLVWIHGGRFTIGSAHNLFYQGQYLADAEDVVVVTIQYRTNIFGFPGAPNTPPNLGLLDQRLALEWVRDNIASFHGDPSRITIFGQSAGGVAVDYMTYAFAHDPIVAGVIPMSGTALSMVPNTREESEGSWFSAAEAAGCASERGDEEEVMKCMRGKTADKLLDAVKQVPFAPTKALPQPVFHPTIDDKIVFSDYESLSESGAFAKIPYLVGNTAKESGFYAISAYTSNTTLSPYQWTLFNAAGFTCPSSRAASHRASHAVPVWRYMYHGTWPNSILYDEPGTGDGGSGAYHGSDVAQVFGTAEDVSGGEVEDTVEEEGVQRGMMRAWGAFARDPVRGLEREMGWVRYGEGDGREKKVVGLAYWNEVLPTFLEAEEVDGVCEVVGTDTSFAKGAF